MAVQTPVQPITGPAMPLELLTTPEVAELLRVTPRHIQTLTNRRILRPIRLGRTVRFLRRSVMDAMLELEKQAA